MKTKYHLHYILDFGRQIIFGSNSAQLFRIKFFGSLIFGLFSMVQSYAATYTSVTNGNWGSGGTWTGGTAPGSTINSGDVVNIGHVVTYNLANDLEVSGTVNINGGTFRTALSGNGSGRSVIIRQGGNWNMNNGEMYLPLFSCGYGCSTGANLNGNFKIDKNGTITISASKVDVAQNWEDVSDPGSGHRTFNGGCLRVGENFLNKGSVDLYDGACIEIGLHGSGNFKNEYKMTFQNSNIIKLVGSGNFENSSGPGILGGSGSPDIEVLYISNGNLVNDKPWTAQVLNFCISGGSVSGSMASDFSGDVTNNDNSTACNAANSAECNDCTGTSNPTGQLGDYVWLDADGDGQQDANESPLTGIQVILHKPGGTTQSTFTNNVGKYLFTDLPAGTYSIEFLLPGDVIPTLANTGNDATDSDIIPTVDGNGLISNIVLASGQVILTLDAGVNATDCDCHLDATNLLNNSGFENPYNPSSWTISNGSLSRPTGNLMCGNFSGSLNRSSGTARIYQNVPDILPGASVTLTGFAGVTNAGLACNAKVKLNFYNSSNQLIPPVVPGDQEWDVTKSVDDPNYLLEFFIIATSAPANTSYAQVEGIISCSSLLLDALCLTASGGNEQNLPIQSLVFNPLEMYKDEIKLSWTTLNELNTDRFEIFRSTDNMQTWTKVSEVPALGQSSGEHTYAYMDKMDKNSPKVSYKINQRDLDGKYNATQYRTIHLKFGQLALEGFPNPARSIYRLQIQSREAEKLNLVLLDIMGRPVIQEKVQVDKGYNMKEIALGQIPAGTYKLRVSGKTTSELITLVKVE